MRRRIIFIFFVALAVIALIVACGSGGGGGSERYSTVEIFASYDEGTYEADARSLVDTDKDDNSCCDTALTFADSVIATVTSTAYDPLPTNADPCDVNILRYTLEYYPQTEETVSVPLRTIQQSINIPAPESAGSSVEKEIPIEIFTNNDKRLIINPAYDASSEAEFQYNIKVTLTMEEVCTRIKEKVQFWVSVRYFDAFTDECTICPP